MHHSTLLLASNNAGKLAELSRALQDLQLTIQTPHDLSIALDVIEDADDYQGNALKKARAFAAVSHLPTLADDSGIEVEAFDNFPGLHSARWMSGTDEERVAGLLKKLAASSDTTETQNRTARFVCELCLYLPATEKRPEQSYFFSGVCSGTLSLQPRGTEGFAYDTIFIPDGYTKTFAELGAAVKMTLSHRHKAFESLKQHLQSHGLFEKV